MSIKRGGRSEIEKFGDGIVYGCSTTPKPDCNHLGDLAFRLEPQQSSMSISYHVGELSHADHLQGWARFSGTSSKARFIIR
jgi:hypothetical protein